MTRAHSKNGAGYASDAEVKTLWTFERKKKIEPRQPVSVIKLSKNLRLQEAHTVFLDST